LLSKNVKSNRRIYFRHPASSTTSNRSQTLYEFLLAALTPENEFEGRHSGEFENALGQFNNQQDVVI